MAETKIEWADYTWNPWRGCTKIAAGCANCYAEKMSGRNHWTLGVWGPNGKRVVAAESYWKLPEKWDREIVRRRKVSSGVTNYRVFLGSLMDIFEDWTGPMVDVRGEKLWHLYPPSGTWVSDTHGHADKKPLTMQDVRSSVFQLIDQTPHLDWLLLTKRPENAAGMVPWKHVSYANAKSPAGAACASMFDPWPPNLWLGMSASTQEDLDRGLPHLLKVPAAVRFLSLEPLLGPVDIEAAMAKVYTGGGVKSIMAGNTLMPRIGWVIVGCESGPNRRPMRTEWAASIAAQCKAAGVPFFMKQMEVDGKVTGDISLFPKELQRREVPGRLLDGREWNEMPTIG